MPQPVRSFLAILAGLFTMMAVVIILTLACVAVFHLQSGHPTHAYLIVNLIYSFAAAFLGGYVAARIAQRSPLVHGLALALIVATFSILSLRHPAPGQSFAYLFILAVATPAAVVAGAALAAKTFKTQN